METVFNSSVYKRSRVAYATQCTIEHLVFLMVGDAIFTKLLTYLGLSDSLVGIITSFASVAFVFQLLSIKLVQSKISTKKMVVFLDVLSQGLFMLLFFTPFIHLPPTFKKLFVAGAVMIAQVSKSIIATMYFKWANTYVSPKKRAIFSAKKESISLFCGIVFSLLIGLIIDKFEEISNLKGAFLFIGCSMVVMNIANLISFLLIKDESVTARKEMQVPLKEVLQHYVTNKIYFKYSLTTFLRSLGSGMLINFLGVYKVNDLAFAILTLQIMNIAADVLRMVVSQPIGKLSQKIGYLKGIEVGHLINLVGIMSIIFTTPQTRWLMVVYVFTHAISQAFIYQNGFNVRYTLLPTKYMIQASSITQTISGLVSFFSALLGGKILTIIQENGNMIFGYKLYGQQFLAIIASTILIISLILRYFIVVKPMEKIKEENL